MINTVLYRCYGSIKVKNSEILRQFERHFEWPYASKVREVLKLLQIYES